MSWGIVAGTVVAGVASYAGSKKSASASQRGTDATIAEQARQYDQTRADFAPFRQLGNAAIGDINRLYGRSTSAPMSFEEWSRGQPTQAGPDSFIRGIGRVAGVGTGPSRAQYDEYVANFEPAVTSGGNPDMSVFFASPEYKFNLDEGQRAIDRSLAARGKALSGAGVRAGARYASGLASSEFSNFYNRLASQAGIGQTAAGSTAAAGAQAAGNIGQAYMANGANQAQAAGNMYAGINNAVQGGMQNYMLMRYLNQKQAGSAPSFYG